MPPFIQSSLEASQPGIASIAIGPIVRKEENQSLAIQLLGLCLLYTSDAADE